MRNVIDVSAHQLSFDPAKAKAAGVDAVAIRLCYGASPDTKALNWASGIKDAGLPLWGYGFATWHYQEVNAGSAAAARNQMRRQVSSWIHEARSSGVDGYLAIDQELEKNKHMALGMDINTTILNEAVTLIREAGFKPLIYCSVSWDFSYIRTSALDKEVNYWFAYYPDSCRALPFEEAAIDMVPAGRYGDWMLKCYNNGRLAGWQYGGGYGFLGARYGCGSEHVDRNLWYIPPEDNNAGTVELHAVKTSPMTKGDLEAVRAVLEDRAISYEVM